jgi:hypothetical protein
VRRLAILLLAGCSAPRIELEEGTLEALFEWESRHGRVPDGSVVTVRGRLRRDLAERAVRWRRWSSIRAADAEEEAREILRKGGLPLYMEARVIEFGWDIPDPAYLRANIESMERVPFDGVVLDVDRFSWKAFVRRLPEDTFAKALEDLRATRFRRFRHNFLRLNVGVVEDWPGAVANVAMAGRFVREAGLRGILFDTEPYQGTEWEGSDEVMRRRGREFGEAYGREAPESTILLTFGYSHGHKGFDGLAPFLDGMLEALPASVEVVDGYENSYGFKTREAFEAGRRAVRSSSPVRVRVGFGLWMDFEKRWTHFTPSEFRSALAEARTASDGWVWVYTEQSNWWTGKGLPAGYLESLKRD